LERMGRLQTELAEAEAVLLKLSVMLPKDAIPTPNTEAITRRVELEKQKAAILAQIAEMDADGSSTEDPLVEAAALAMETR